MRLFLRAGTSIENTCTRADKLYKTEHPEDSAGWRKRSGDRVIGRSGDLENRVIGSSGNRVIGTRSLALLPRRKICVKKEEIQG